MAAAKMMQRRFREERLAEAEHMRLFGGVAAGLGIDPSTGQWQTADELVAKRKGEALRREIEKRISQLKTSPK